MLNSSNKDTTQAMILDLDLDCFIEGIARHKPDDSPRLDDTEHPPWNEDRFRYFLEHQCGLSKERRIPGKVLTYHVEAFELWRKLISTHQLRPPFGVVHVDAHSDLGLGETSYIYLMTEFLDLPMRKRIYPPKGTGYLTSGSYLAFACACRWIRDLTFVYHPERSNRPDFMWLHFKDFDPSSGFIQLKKYNAEDFKGRPLQYLKTVDAELVEPQIPFCQICVNDYENRHDIQLATISQSPGFTPPAGCVNKNETDFAFC